MKSYIQEIEALIHDQKANTSSLQTILLSYNIPKIDHIKEDLLDIILNHIHSILKDHLITPEEKSTCEYLKKLFKIKEGDFYKYRRNEVEKILHIQFERIYKDQRINQAEALHKIDLQEIFDLSYDQMESFKLKSVLDALDSGANILDLDTTHNPNKPN
jgi:hypothetical protein